MIRIPKGLLLTTLGTCAFKGIAGQKVFVGGMLFQLGFRDLVLFEGILEQPRHQDAGDSSIEMTFPADTGLTWHNAKEVPAVHH